MNLISHCIFFYYISRLYFYYHRLQHPLLSQRSPRVRLSAAPPATAASPAAWDPSSPWTRHAAPTRTWTLSGLRSERWIWDPKSPWTRHGGRTRTSTRSERSGGTYLLRLVIRSQFVRFSSSRSVFRLTGSSFVLEMLTQWISFSPS